MKIAEKSLKSLEFDKILEKLAIHARLEQSKTMCLNANTYNAPLDVRAQLDLTKEAKTILDMALELPLEGVANIDRITKSTINSYLKEEEIVDVAKTIKTSRLVKNFLKANWNILKY